MPTKLTVDPVKKPALYIFQMDGSDGGTVAVMANNAAALNHAAHLSRQLGRDVHTFRVSVGQRVTRA